MGTNDERKRPVLRALVGVLVIFFGVWLGLLAENYREYRQERADEQDSLERLVRDLEADYEDMTGNLRRAEIGGSAAVWIGEHADRQGVDRDSLAHYLAELLRGGSWFLPNTSEYSALKNSGRLNIIENAELRQELTELHETDYRWLTLVHGEEAELIRRALFEIPSSVRYSIEVEGFWPRVQVVGDPSDLLSDHAFLNYVALIGLYRRAAASRYGQMLPLNESLRNRLLAELGRAEDVAAGDS